uniref:CUB and zona pellucida-like domains 1, tandem duplicate 1 n=1 Tax=Salarias fasciatus TaxID=181472 RepID=A0A672GJF9_SALFA
PNHYHDHAYCTWTIRAANNQRVSLAFTDMELENCCGCDYIDVYDGPSSSYNLLGKICHDSTLTSFHSTSTYMTVVFRSDISVTARGFKAEFMSSLQPSSVSCTSDTMNIVIERSYLNSMGYSSHDLYLNDEQCRPQITSYQVIFSFPIGSCGNVRQISNDRVVYTNGLRSSNSSSGEITRHAVLKLNVTCIMDQDSLSENVFVIQNPGNSSIIGTGKFNTTMTFYTSSSFSYPVTEFPYEVELNEYIYVKVDLKSSDNSLVIFLDTCVASPSPHDFQTRAYYLVRNGCTADSTYYAYTSGTQKYARFRVKTFQFLRASESVYLQCKVLVCQASDYNSRCRRGCITRRARDLGSRHDSQTLVLGPIKLKGLYAFQLYYGKIMTFLCG